MLQPIKNFLTYFQKNTNNTTLLGVTTNMSENTNRVVGDHHHTENPSYGSQNKNPSENLCSPSPIKSHDQNENEVIVITEESSPPKRNDERNDNFLKESKEITHNITIECLSDTEAEVSNDGFTVNEIILDENDAHNSSLTDPGTDPLAIEDYNADVSNNKSLMINSEQNPINLDTSTDEGETILIIDVEEIKDSENLTDEANSKNDTINSDADRDEHREELFETPRLPLDDIGEEQEIRSDGSDSGLGSETSALQTTTNSVDTSVVSIDSSVTNLEPARSNLKRQSNEITIVPEKKLKRSIHFDGVKVYYFPRIQGFACVPSQGGCTLGMGSRHTHCRNFTLAEHAAEQRRVHKQQMQEINPRGSSSEETDSDEELSEASGSDLDADANGFLQPVPARQRRAILKAAGIRKIDSAEKDECRAIRSSREFCGCSCRGYCDPETCSCSQAGIKCQVDRPSFPCGCTRDGCANVVGRIEFNPNRVRTHFIHTIMRLELENKEKTSLELNSESNHLLSYGNSCASSNNSNMSVTAAANATTNNLSNICNYSLSNISMLRSQHYGHIPMQQHNQNYLASNAHSSNNSNIYTNVLQNGVIPEHCTLPHMSSQHQQQIINSGTGCINMLNSSANITAGGAAGVCQTQQMDISYSSFRDITTTDTSSVCSSSRNENPSGGANMLLDYSSENYHHGTYGNQSYLNHSYHNSVLNSGSSYSSVVPTYSNYQQHYVAYASSSSNNNNNNNENMEIHDLTTDEESNSYINLHPPTGNTTRLDAINDLLQSNRNTLPAAPSISDTAPLIDSVAIKSPSTNVVTTPIMCTLAPSAQTSTSITDGTSTTVSPQKNKTVSQLNTSSNVENFVDLTDDGITSPHKSYTTTVLFLDNSKEESLQDSSSQLDNMMIVRKRRDSDVEIIESTENKSNIQKSVLEYSTSILSPKSPEKNIDGNADKEMETILTTCDNYEQLTNTSEQNDEIVFFDCHKEECISDEVSVSFEDVDGPKKHQNLKDIDLVEDSNYKCNSEISVENTIELDKQRTLRTIEEIDDVELVGITVNNTALANSIEVIDIESMQNTGEHLDSNVSSVVELSPSKTTTTAKSTTITTLTSISSKTTEFGKPPHESDENLTEIINKSIVEIVSV